MKIAHVSYSDGTGGAARAAFRLHRALVTSGIDSKMYVVDRVSDDYRVVGMTGKIARLIQKVRNNLAQIAIDICTEKNQTVRSLAFSGSGLLSRAQRDGCDVVNLHWIGGESVGLSELARVKKPLVWRVADMWPFCGAEHYAGTGSTARWRLGYDITKPEFQARFDIDRLVWLWKRKFISKNVHFVATTFFVADCLKQSALFNNSPVTVIPNTLDTRIYQPWPRTLARELFGFPQEVPIVAFGAIGGTADPRKGWDILKPALGILASRIGEIEGVIFGQSEPPDPPRLGMPLHWVGHLRDDATLAMLYSAVDVMVVPSRQETFGQTASEAQACGTPVVSFNAGGLPDVVAHRVSGYLAEPYSSEALANGIQWVLEDQTRHAALSKAARARAVTLWAPEVVVPQYMAVYEASIGLQGFVHQ